MLFVYHPFCRGCNYTRYHTTNQSKHMNFWPDSCEGHMQWSQHHAFNCVANTHAHCAARNMPTPLSYEQYGCPSSWALRYGGPLVQFSSVTRPSLVAGRPSPVTRHPSLVTRLTSPARRLCNIRHSSLVVRHPSHVAPVAGHTHHTLPVAGHPPPPPPPPPPITRLPSSVARGVGVAIPDPVHSACACGWNDRVHVSLWRPGPLLSRKNW